MDPRAVRGLRRRTVLVDGSRVGGETGAGERDVLSHPDRVPTTRAHSHVRHCGARPSWRGLANAGQTDGGPAPPARITALRSSEFFSSRGGGEEEESETEIREDDRHARRL